MCWSRLEVLVSVEVEVVAVVAVAVVVILLIVARLTTVWLCLLVYALLPARLSCASRAKQKGSVQGVPGAAGELICYGLYATEKNFIFLEICTTHSLATQATASKKPSSIPSEAIPSASGSRLRLGQTTVSSSI